MNSYQSHLCCYITYLLCKIFVIFMFLHFYKYKKRKLLVTVFPFYGEMKYHDLEHFY